MVTTASIIYTAYPYRHTTILYHTTPRFIILCVRFIIIPLRFIICTHMYYLPIETRPDGHITPANPYNRSIEL